MPTPAVIPDVVEFGHLRIAFDDRVLRPRAWTAAQSAWAADLLTRAPDGPVLELCAGAGHIGLLAIADSERRLVCVDVDPVACAYARRNAAAAGVADRVDVRQGPMEQAVRGSERFALVIADPPWVRRSEVARFPADPVLAIDGGADGLAVAQTCVALAREHLDPGGHLLLQLGTPEQVDLLTPYALEQMLTLDEVRVGERGVLALLTRRPVVEEGA